MKWWSTICPRLPARHMVIVNFILFGIVQYTLPSLLSKLLPCLSTCVLQTQKLSLPISRAWNVPTCNPYMNFCLTFFDTKVSCHRILYTEQNEALTTPLYWKTLNIDGYVFNITGFRHWFRGGCPVAGWLVVRIHTSSRGWWREGDGNTGVTAANWRRACVWGSSLMYRYVCLHCDRVSQLLTQLDEALNI